MQPSSAAVAPAPSIPIYEGSTVGLDAAKEYAPGTRIPGGGTTTYRKADNNLIYVHLLIIENASLSLALEARALTQYFSFILL